MTTAETRRRSGRLSADGTCCESRRRRRMRSGVIGRTKPVRLALLVATAVVSTALPAAAQDLDLAFTQPPVVMLGIDSSGSMQWRGTGIIRDDLAGITCALASTEKTREIVVKEVLTGSFQDYSLNTVTANTSGFGQTCQTGKHTPNYTTQGSDGLIDLYREKIRFAVSSFDNDSNYYNDGRNGGDWSYPGTGNPAPQDGRVVKICGATSTSCDTCNCGGTCIYKAGTHNRYYCYGNVGIRSEKGNPCTGAGCMLSAGQPGTDIGEQNDLVKTDILAISSGGETPIAGMLKDIRWWFDNHNDVKLQSGGGNLSNLINCRKAYTVLVTDGLPNQNCGYSDASRARPEICFGHAPCSVDTDCPSDVDGEGNREWSCVNGNCWHALRNEPLLAAAQRAADLLNPPDTSKRSVPVHVIGFDTASALSCVGDSDCPNGQVCTATGGGAKACSCIDDSNCGTGESCVAVKGIVKECRLGGDVQVIATAGGGQVAFARDFEGLRGVFNKILSGLAPETTARTRPTSTAAVAPLKDLPTSFPEQNAEALFLFQAAFAVKLDDPHWRGFLQRVTIGNQGTVESPIIGPLAQGDADHGTVRFDTLLNTQPRPVDDSGSAYDRRIYTYINGQIVEFIKQKVSAADLNVKNTTERDTLIDYIRGETGSLRAANRLGAIYHSSPVVLEPPVLEVPDPAYKVYQADPDIRARPPMVFVGSNLGMLHAFNAQTGKEEWAFIPTALLPTLKDQLSGFAWGVDGTPVARDIQLSTINAASDSLRNWRAVVAVGVGYGATATFALDVTKPVWSNSNNPPFKVLFQFDNNTADPQDKLGIPFGSPAIGTVFLDDPGAGYPFQERAVVVLPGGKKPQGAGIGGNQGEDIWVLDLATGSIIRRLDGTPGGGGMTGTCAVFDDFPGSFLSRAYCGDNKGKISRINIADPVIANWTSTPEWFDLYQGLTGGRQQPIFAAPTLARRANGNLMIVAGNGNPNDLQSTDPTRLAFIEDVPQFDLLGVLTGISPTLRKMHIFPAGEKLTGSPVIFNSIAYFATFLPEISDSCAFGRTKIYGVSFDQFGALGEFIPKLESVCGPDSIFETSDDAQGITESCLLPLGSVTFGFDVVRAPSAAQFTGSASGGSGSGSGSGSSTHGGDIKLVFQTGTAVIDENSALRDPQLTPPGAQSIQVGAINLPDITSRTRVLSWGRVLTF